MTPREKITIFKTKDIGHSPYFENSPLSVNGCEGNEYLSFKDGGKSFGFRDY